MFHAREPAAAKDRSPSDDVVRGTAAELDAADLRPGLTIAAADGVIRSAMYDGASPYKQRCTIIITQLVLDALFDWQPMAVA